MRYIDSNLRVSLIGAVSSFFGSAIGEAINNELIEKNHKRIDISAPNYYSSVIAGAFAAPIIENTDTLKGVVVAVGLNKVIFDVVDKLFGNEGINYSELIKNFIFDSIMSYFIVLILLRITELFKKDNDESNSNQEEEEEQDGINEDIFGDIIISVVINIYYALKRK